MTNLSDYADEPVSTLSHFPHTIGTINRTGSTAMRSFHRARLSWDTQADRARL
ncbi:uncharacterized protein METZ01_LOCUS69100 [marine metagenome]|uniref:Uncharacterized protein n=1 Tax=marine metagenome TaxID=408172 RepID=A0A381TJH6_9ZZZZ